MGKTGKLFSDLKEPKKQPDKDFRIEVAQDFERLKAESKAYWYLMKRVSDLRDVAMYHVMLTAGEPIGAQWKARLQTYDEILGIPSECEMKAVEAESEEKLTSVV